MSEQERRSGNPRRVPSSGYPGPERRVAKQDRRGAPPQVIAPPFVRPMAQKPPFAGTLQSSEALKECVRAHEEAVIENDEYGVADLAKADPNIQYIVDIGGNVGCASLQFQRFYPEAKIICAEPEPENMKYAKINTGQKLIYTEKAVVGDEKLKEVKFNVCQWGGNHHVDGHFRWDLFEPMGSKKVSEITVPAITLKKLMDDNKFPRIDLLKIDCEGLEGGILLGFKPYMKLVNHFRGEWHGEDDIPRILEALQDTHDVVFDRKYTTHGGIFAEPKKK